MGLVESIFYHKIKKDGHNNNVSIGKNVRISCKICGNNNSVFIGDAAQGTKAKIKINIRGNYNIVHIESISNCNKLFLDMGNFTGVDHAIIRIGERFICCDTTVLAYQSGTPIQVGNDCLFSHSVKIRSGELPHVIYSTLNGENLDKSDGIYIGNHVWLGENATIMKNVTIPNNCIIGTSAVVTKRFVEENSIIAGNPAKICKQNVTWAPTAALLSLQSAASAER